MICMHDVVRRGGLYLALCVAIIIMSDDIHVRPEGGSNTRGVGINLLEVGIFSHVHKRSGWEGTKSFSPK